MSRIPPKNAFRLASNCSGLGPVLSAMLCIVGFVSFHGARAAGAVAPERLENVYYRYRIIAEQDALFRAFTPGVAINSAGQVAFVEEGPGLGGARSEDNLWRGSVTGVSALLSTEDRKQMLFPSINRRGAVATYLGTGSLGAYDVQLFVFDGQLQTRIAGIKDPVPGKPDLLLDFAGQPAINGRGDVAFVADLQDRRSGVIMGSALFLSSGGALKMVLPDVPRFETTVLGLADDGRILVMRDKELLVVKADGSTDVLFAGTTYQGLGTRAGISGDGSLVAFARDRGNGVGVFLAVDDGKGGWSITRLAGENAATGVSVSEDLGRNADGTSNRFAAFDVLGRIAVIRLPVTPGRQAEGQFIVSFGATPERVRSAIVGDTIAFSDQYGLWTMRGEFSTRPTVRVVSRPALPVIQLGDILGSLLDPPVVTDLRTYEPLAQVDAPASAGSCEPTGPDHRFAFWVETSKGQRVVLAEPIPIPILPIIRQGNPLWADERYAPVQVDAYLSNPAVVNPERAKLLAALPNITLRKKGCLLSSLAMALNTLLDRVDQTTHSLHTQYSNYLLPITAKILDRKDDPSRVGEFSGVLRWHTPTWPALNGTDLPHAKIAKDYRLAPRTVKHDTNAPASFREAVIEALRNRQPVLLNVKDGGHWVIARSFLGCESGDPVFDIIDPGLSSGGGDGRRPLSSLMVSKAIVLSLLDPFAPRSSPGMLAEEAQPAGQPPGSPSRMVLLQLQGADRFLVTDSRGRRFGTDPSTGEFFREIPDALEVPDLPILEPELVYSDEEVAVLSRIGSRFIQLPGVGLDELRMEAVSDTRSEVALTGGDIDGLAGSSITIPPRWSVPGSPLELVLRQSPEPLRLGFERNTEGRLSLHWPDICPDCELQSTASLAADSIWTPITTPSESVDGHRRTSVDGRAKTLFYRLIGKGGGSGASVEDSQDRERGPGVN